MEEKDKKIGILNKGKNNTFADNTFEGLDVAIQDEGEGTLGFGNRFNNRKSVATRERWSTDHLPEGYPTQCDTGQLKNIIQDLSDERYQNTMAGKINKIWEKLISDLIQSGRDELSQRTGTHKKGRTWFSMNNPFVWIVASLILTILAAAIWYWADSAGFPLKFGSN